MKSEKQPNYKRNSSLPRTRQREQATVDVRVRGSLGVVLARGRQIERGRESESETETTLKGIKVAFGCRSRNLIKDLCLCFIHTHTHTDAAPCTPTHAYSYTVHWPAGQTPPPPPPRLTNPLSRPRTVLIFSSCDLQFQFQFQFQFGSRQVDSSLLSLSYLFVSTLPLSPPLSHSLGSWLWGHFNLYWISYNVVSREFRLKRWVKWHLPVVSRFKSQALATFQACLTPSVSKYSEDV